VSDPTTQDKGRKRVVIRLTRRQQSDPRSILDATRQALKYQCGLALEVRVVPDPVASPPSPLAQTELDIAVLFAVAAALEAVARQEAAEPPAEKKPDPLTWWGRVKAWGDFIAKEGIKAFIGEGAKKVGGS
jgi:hypothetical protein